MPPEQYRLISGRTANTEKEEATFNFLKNVTNLTSNHHSDNILTNSIIRFQMKKEINVTQGTKIKDSFIFNIYKPIKQIHISTTISFHWIKTHSFQYQRLLERIADYLIDEGIWWRETNQGVEFLDLKNDNFKSMHHFRSWSIKEETKFIKECWSTCLEQKNTLIPTFKLKIKNDNESTIHYLTTLAHFKEEALLKNKEESTDTQNDGKDILIATQVHQNKTSPHTQSIDTTENDGKAILIAKQVHQNKTSIQTQSTDTTQNDGKDILIATQVHHNKTYNQNPTSAILNLEYSTAGHSTTIESCKNKTPINLPHNNSDLTPDNTLNLPEFNITPIEYETDFTVQTMPKSTTNINQNHPVSSTPIINESKKEKKENIISIVPTTVKQKEIQSKLSTSSVHLTKIFGSENIIYQFDQARKKLKQAKSLVNIKSYEIILAKVEVKLNIREKELKLMLKDFEAKRFLNEEFDQDKYENTISILKYINIVCKEINL